MPTVKVMEDQHGSYVRANGHVFRPQPSSVSVGKPGGLLSVYCADEWVNVQHRHGSQSAVIRGGGRMPETWYSHGGYYGLDEAGPLPWNPR